MAQAQLRIEGMHCKSCKRLLEDVCSDVVGVESCVVDPATGKMEVAYSDALDWGAFDRAIAELKDYRMTERSFVCPQCGFAYREEQKAKECSAWCTEHKSCNIEITRHAISGSSTSAVRSGVRS